MRRSLAGWSPRARYRLTCARGESAVALDVGLGHRRFLQGKTCSVPVLALTSATNLTALTAVSMRTCCVLHGEVRTLIWSFAQSFGRFRVRITNLRARYGARKTRRSAGSWVVVMLVVVAVG